MANLHQLAHTTPKRTRQPNILNCSSEHQALVNCSTAGQLHAAIGLFGLTCAWKSRQPGTDAPWRGPQPTVSREANFGTLFCRSYRAGVSVVFFFWHLFGSVDIHIGKAIGPEKVNDLKPRLMGANADLQPPRHAGERRIPRTGFYIFTYISYCRANPRLRPRRLVKMGYHKCAGYVGLVHTTLGRAASSS